MNPLLIFLLGILVGTVSTMIGFYLGYVAIPDAYLLWCSVRDHGGERIRTLTPTGQVIQRVFQRVQRK